MAQNHTKTSILKTLPTFLNSQTNDKYSQSEFKPLFISVPNLLYFCLLSSTAAQMTWKHRLIYCLCIFNYFSLFALWVDITFWKKKKKVFLYTSLLSFISPSENSEWVMGSQACARSPALTSSLPFSSFRINPIYFCLLLLFSIYNNWK